MINVTVKIGEKEKGFLLLSELRKMVQVGLAGESVVGSYSYRDEVKQNTKWVEIFITGDGARES